jgi:alkylation response protein AidB-like acyl-CoA dehydrogenase
MDTLDRTRRQARVSLADAPATLLGTEGEAGGAVSVMLDHAAAALAAEQVGGAQRVLDMAVEYAKVRTQFGRPIGSFQAIKHKCADMLVDVERARAAAQYAALVASSGGDDLPLVVSTAKAFCSEVSVRAATANIQVHGGIGFTWEHSAHLYFKRAHTSAALFGDPTAHRARVAGRLFLGMGAIPADQAQKTSRPAHAHRGVEVP